MCRVGDYSLFANINSVLCLVSWRPRANLQSSWTTISSPWQVRLQARPREHTNVGLLTYLVLTYLLIYSLTSRRSKSKRQRNPCSVTGRRIVASHVHRLLILWLQDSKSSCRGLSTVDIISKSTKAPHARLIRPRRRNWSQNTAE